MLWIILDKKIDNLDWINLHFLSMGVTINNIYHLPAEKIFTSTNISAHV